MKATKKYTMYNKEKGITITCTEKFVMDWIARGFEVKEIKNIAREKSTRNSEENYTNHK